MSFLIFQALVESFRSTIVESMEPVLVEDYAFHIEESDGLFLSEEEAVSWRFLLRTYYPSRQSAPICLWTICGYRTTLKKTHFFL